MEVIDKAGTKQHPRILLDKDNNKFLFSGRSLPEDSNAFFAPVLEWLDNYAKSPLPHTIVEIKLVYYNTSSAKLISEILEKFEEIHKSGSPITIKWYYLDIDDDMKKSGEIYADMLELPIELISYTL